MKSFAIGLVALLLVPGLRAVAATDDPSGVRAFEQGRFAEALKDWTEAAARGDGVAARYLGVLYDTGEGVPQDRAQALSWYRRGADLGDVGSMFNVAICYDSGGGGPRDAREAARWYARAAARHFGRAEYNLALMALDGDGVPRDPARAARLFRDAAADGIAAAASHTGAWRVMAVARAPSMQNGDALFASAQRALLSRTASQAATAASLFARAASQDGSAGLMAGYDLAWCYEHGVGVPQDRARAEQIYRAVAERTDDPGLRDLADKGALAAAAADGVSAPPGSASASLPAVAETPAVSRGGRSD